MKLAVLTVVALVAVLLVVFLGVVIVVLHALQDWLGDDDAP